MQEEQPHPSDAQSQSHAQAPPAEPARPQDDRSELRRDDGQDSSDYKIVEHHYRTEDARGDQEGGRRDEKSQHQRETDTQPQTENHPHHEHGSRSSSRSRSNSRSRSRSRSTSPSKKRAKNDSKTKFYVGRIHTDTVEEELKVPFSQ